MPWNSCIDSALTLPNGARFFRCALQVNPSHYAATYRGAASSLSDEEYTSQLIAKAVECDVQVLAITDHNHVGSVASIAAKAAVAGITVFPGFEVRSKEGVHFLCLFPSDTASAQLERYLGALGIHDPSPSDGLSSLDCGDIPRYVAAQGGIVIAAHVTSSGGMLTALEGKACIAAWRNKDLLAVQIPGAVEDLPQKFKGIVRNTNAEYQRDPAPAGNLALAIVNAKDVAHPDDLADVAATCLIKMTSPTIEGLRQAFLDPQSRIRLNGDESVHSDFDFVALAWQGGFLDGITLHLNDNLNVLIGGRGTGKSTIVESIRYAIGLTALGEDAQRAHDSIVKHVLMSGTKVSLLIRSQTPSPAEYLVERTVPNRPIVRSAAGTLMKLAPADLVPGVEVFGQHEMSELTKSPEKLTQLLARFLDTDSGSVARRADLKVALERNRSDIIDGVADLKRIDERLELLPRLEETLKRYQEAGVESRLRDSSLLVKEERKLAKCDEALDAFTKPMRQLHALVPIDTDFVNDDALDGLPGASLLQPARTVLAETSTALATALSAIDQALTSAQSQLATVRSGWRAHKATFDAALQKTLRELQRTKIDGEEYLVLRRDIEELQPLQTERLEAANILTELRELRAQLLTDWQDLLSTEVRAIQLAAKRVNRQLTNVVRVSVTPSGDRGPLFEFLRSNIGGQIKGAIEKLKAAETLSLADLSAACREGAATLTKDFGIAGAAADRFASVGEITLLEMEELDLPHTTQIELNIAQEGQTAMWRSLDELSTGQKATAILLLLLLDSDAPLIIDQPEDDLDNRFITDGIVPKLRDAKRKRQFVLTTHNANIPVLGDAELIVALVSEAADGLSKVTVPLDHIGALDSPSVREVVESVLEGGKDAFEARRRKYGF